MAGSHKVRVTGAGRNCWFEVSAKPAHLLSRVPVLGPFVTYNLGRNPRFIINVQYLGYVTRDECDTPDPTILPSLADQKLWNFDLVLHIEGDYIEGGDDLLVNLSLTTLQRKQQQYLTRVWPLTRPGRAELQIGVPHPYTEALYSFEVKDTAVTLANAAFATVGGIIGGTVGWILTKVFSS